MLGLIVSLAFRTYFISMYLDKTGIEVDYRKIGMIVAIAMISNVLMFSVPLILQSSDYSTYIETGSKIWNLLLILIGIVSVYNIKWRQGIILLLIMSGFEMMFKYIIGGMIL